MFYLISFFISISQAYLPKAGPISMAQGGGGRAAFDVVESLYLNPAAIAINDKYFMGGSFFNGELTPGVSGSEWGFAATDGNPENLFPASLGYRYTNFDFLGQETKLHTLRVAAAYAMKGLSFGAGVQRMSANSPGLALDVVEYQLDLGALYSINEKILIGLVGNNLLAVNDNIPIGFQNQKTIALGTYFVGASNFTLRWDVVYPTQNNDEKHLVHQLGIDSKFYDEFHFRAGYELDDHVSQNRYTLGFGWEGPRLKFAYAFQQTTRNGTGNRHMIDLWLNF